MFDDNDTVLCIWKLLVEIQKGGPNHIDGKGPFRASRVDVLTIDVQGTIVVDELFDDKN
jgi:hypothetical protein